MSITCLGHSLGGALATLCAYQIAEDQIHKTPSGIIAPVTAFTFASTRVGNTAFRERMESLGVKVLRIKSKQDIIPCYPLGQDTDHKDILESVKQDVKQSAERTPIRDLLGFFVRKLKQAIQPDEYTHVGQSLEVDFTKSPFLKQPKFIDVDIIETLGNYHNLDGYLHLVNGIVGTNDDEKMPFKLVVVRDLALINKSADLLTDPSGKNVPANWWKQSNAGLVQNKEGFWVCVSNFDDPKAPNPDFD
ncbi:hypothetical protein R1flu_026093 [Riccia fluitans]|uniref:Phospholipase A1 n=1 Tax=Riccia fluitans TaxID=41844 RepID=A0ABD1XEZ7_9MARC